MALRVQLRKDVRQPGPRLGPWIRKRQIARILGPANPAAIAEVVDRNGATIGWGLLSPVSDIVVRMVRYGEDRPGDDWLEQRLALSFAARDAYGFAEDDTTGYRLVNSEGDGIPGLVIDRYGDEQVVQISTAPMAAREDRIIGWLRSQGHERLHVVLPEVAARKEGFEPSAVAAGPGQTLSFREHGLEFRVPAPPSQKTGAYFDQRGNRRVIAHLARRHGGPLLDVGCHVGGFALHARRLGIPSIGVDQSRTALRFAAENAAANGWSDVRWIEADMFGDWDVPGLGGPFGTIVLDPPRMTQNPRTRDRALGALERMVRTLAPRVAPFGHFVLCSCSHHIDGNHIDAAMARAGAARWARVATLGPGFDHPVDPTHLEGSYLRVHVYQLR